LEQKKKKQNTKTKGFLGAKKQKKGFFGPKHKKKRFWDQKNKKKNKKKRIFGTKKKKDFLDQKKKKTKKKDFLDQIFFFFLPLLHTTSNNWTILG